MRELRYDNSYFYHQLLWHVEALTNKYGDNDSLKVSKKNCDESAFSPIKYGKKYKLRLFNSSFLGCGVEFVFFGFDIV